MGLGLLTCGLKVIDTWAEQNRASILVQQRLCLNETQAPFRKNRASVASRYSIKEGTKIIHFCIQVRFQAKTSMKRGFIEELKAEGGFYFYYSVVELTGTSTALNEMM